LTLIMNEAAISTHGIVSQPGNRIRASSNGLGWHSVAASMQSEIPFEGAFNPVDDHLLVLHLNGPARVSGSIGEWSVERAVPPGRLFLWPGGESFRVSLRDALDTVHIYLRRELVMAAATELGLDGDPGKLQLIPRLGEQDQLLEQLALEISQSLYSPDPSTTLYVEQIAHLMACRLVRAHSNRSSLVQPTPTGGGLSRAQLDRIDDFIDNNIERRISLSALADAGGLSATWFVRRFRLTTGLPPHQYALRRRVMHAQRLLSETDLSIAAIAFDCGFAHQEHLTRAFRKFSGTTPANYRRQHRRPYDTAGDRRSELVRKI
jgi:AraC family transcriptional regulator